jgi:hypothetical protein
MKEIEMRSTALSHYCPSKEEDPTVFTGDFTKTATIRSNEKTEESDSYDMSKLFTNKPLKILL